MATAHLVQTGLGLLPNVWTLGSETLMIGLACSARSARQSASLLAHSCTRFPCYLGMEIYAKTQWTITKIVELGN